MSSSITCIFYVLMFSLELDFFQNCLQFTLNFSNFALSAGHKSNISSTKRVTNKRYMPMALIFSLKFSQPSLRSKKKDIAISFNNFCNEFERITKNCVAFYVDGLLYFYLLDFTMTFQLVALFLFYTRLNFFCDHIAVLFQFLYFYC